MRRHLTLQWILSCILGVFLGVGVSATGTNRDPERRHLGELETTPVDSVDGRLTDNSKADADLIAGLIGECFTILEKTAEQIGTGLETLGCTLSKEGEVSVVGGSEVSGDSLHALKAAIKGIHGLDKYRAVAHLSRGSFEARDGRQLSALKFHVETESGTCRDFRLPYTRGATEEEIEFEAGEVVEKQVKCIFWSE